MKMKLNKSLDERIAGIKDLYGQELDAEDQVGDLLNFLKESKYKDFLSDNKNFIRAAFAFMKPPTAAFAFMKQPINEACEDNYWRIKLGAKIIELFQEHEEYLAQDPELTKDYKFLKSKFFKFSITELQAKNVTLVLGFLFDLTGHVLLLDKVTSMKEIVDLGMKNLPTLFQALKDTYKKQENYVQKAIGAHEGYTGFQSDGGGAKNIKHSFPDIINDDVMIDDDDGIDKGKGCCCVRPGRSNFEQL